MSCWEASAVFLCSAFPVLFRRSAVRKQCGLIRIDCLRRMKFQDRGCSQLRI